MARRGEACGLFNRPVSLKLIVFEQIMLPCGFHALVLLTQDPKVVIVAWGAERQYPAGSHSACELVVEI